MPGPRHTLDPLRRIDLRTGSPHHATTLEDRLTVAIIGTGRIGAALARNLARGGERVVLAGTDRARAAALAAELGERARSASVADAIDAADVVVFAVWLDVMQRLIAEHRARLVGRIVVDPSNPIAPDGVGGFVKIIEERASAGRMIADALPEGAAFVKAFGALSAGTLAEAAHQDPPFVMFYATNDEVAGATVSALIRTAGFEPVRAGGVDASIRIEVFGALHEYGALGRAVHLADALAAR